VRQQAWFEDHRSISAKLELATTAQLGGVGFWQVLCVWVALHLLRKWSLVKVQPRAFTHGRYLLLVLVVCVLEVKS
jgi:hypothetical protein